MPRPLDGKRFRIRVIAGETTRRSPTDIARKNRITWFTANAADADIAHAGNRPPLGWPECGALFPAGKSQEFLTDPIFFSGNLRNLPGRYGLRRGENMDPLTQALHAAGAASAQLRVSRTLGANYQMARIIPSPGSPWTLGSNPRST